MRLTELQPVVRARGGFASVCLDVSRAAEDADQRLRLRWKALIRQLRADGAPDRLIDRIAQRALEPTGHGGALSRFVVATDDDVLLDTLLPRVDERADYGHFGPLPHLMPLLREWADEELLPMRLLQTERKAVSLGSGVYLLHWDADKQRVRVRTYDPGFYFPIVGEDDDGLSSPKLGAALALAAEGIRRLRIAEGPVPLNLWLHAAGHWHIEILPRFGVLAGIELGAGYFVNTLAPESAAGVLRES